MTASLDWPFDTADPRQLVMLRSVAERVAYGNIIRGLVHELRNPMQSMMIAAHALIDDPSPTEGQRTLLDVIQRGSDQSARAVDLLDDVVGERSRADGPVLLHDVVQWAADCQSVSRFQIKGSIELDLSSDIPAVAANERDIATVLTLILNNAKEAIGADMRGSVVVTASCREGDQGVVVAVEDSGTGISATDVEEAFEPFYTTKGHAHLGIGLTAARALLTCYTARVRLKPRERSGARCELWIPKWGRGSP